MGFVTARLAEVAPTVVGGPEGESIARVLGGYEDAENTLLIDGVLMRYPPRAPNDALDEVGRVFLRPRAPTPEATDHAAYRTRLAETSWTHWETAPFQVGGMQSVFTPYDASNLPAVYSNSDKAFDSNTWFSRVFWIWDNALSPDDAWDVGSPTWDDGGLWDIFFEPGSGFGVADYDFIKREIRQAKGSQAYPVFIAVGLSSDGGGPFWDSPGPAWDAGSPSAWDAFPLDGEFTYLPLGRVWEEETLFYGGGVGVWDGDPADIWEEGFVPPTGGW